jgi:hypothetical protein
MFGVHKPEALNALNPTQRQQKPVLAVKTPNILNFKQVSPTYP